jgi:hypothetical protein
MGRSILDFQSGSEFGQTSTEERGDGRHSLPHSLGEVWSAASHSAKPEAERSRCKPASTFEVLAVRLQDLRRFTGHRS